jgi:hypothetical protein
LQEYQLSEIDPDIDDIGGSMKALTLVPISHGEIRIDGNNLRDKIIILPFKAYRNLRYSWTDPCIFCASSLWEEMIEMEQSLYSQQSSLMSPELRYRQASQDY